jgi:hypothetical protein
MKFLFVFIILTVLSAYPQNEYPIESELGRLSYSGNYVSPDSAMDKLFYGYPRFINFSISPDWRPKYPNPFSPSSLFPNNAFYLADTSYIEINLLTKKDSLLMSFYTDNNPPGYYMFSYNSSLIKYESDYASLGYYKLTFVIGDSTYVVPLAHQRK